MFTRKKRELIKTPSISKKSRAGSPGPQSSASSVSRCITSGFSLAPLLSSARVCVLCFVSSGLPLHSWVFTKGQGRGALTPSPLSEGPESTAIEVEDIPALLRDVARFAEAVEKLKDVVLAEGKFESQRPVAHECLGEVLRVLRQVINTYPLLNTVEILTAAGKLISKVKGFHYEACNEADKKDFEKAIETIAVAFSSNVSELLMGEVDSSTLLSLLPTEKSRVSQCSSQVEEVDVILQHSEGGVDSALLYAKTISKYMKDLITYVEKRISLETEFSKGLQRLYQSCKHSITHPHMPLFSIYSLALEQDQEQSVGLQQASTTLHSQTFIQPLMQRKQEHEKRRKEIKEQWIRAKRKLMECEVNLRKAKQAYVVRCEEHDKAKTATCRAEEEGGGSTAKSVEKKKRLEEEARNKADEAEATYRTCIADATTQQLELEHTKVTVLRQLQDVIKQSDQTLRSATISYYQLMHMQTVALPVHYQTLCESSKLYDPGQQYAAHVRDLQLPEQPNVYYTFEAYSPSRQGHKSWGSTVSDDSVAGDGESPTATDVSKIVRTSSTGTMSSNEDADEKDGNVASFETPNINGMDPDVVVSTRPFRNIGLSKAAQTHRLRKLRTPAKCRECDSYVYFQGAECEECFLACHKRCLETLAIQCGHKKLQGRLQLFGREFAQVASCASDGIPFIITKCISEIERRALKMKGIYRVNGVKTRVEKLCQAFENGKELVELSQCSPHDISNVLKLYLRQLPEPIMPFRLYNSLMGLAKESLQSEGDAPEGVEAESNLGPDTDPEVLVLVDKLKELLKELPKANLSTLRYIIRHLRRIAELEEDNKMSPSNLGIVFGPSLMRPRPTGATISLSSLVDYPHQARIVEALIVFYSSIFQSKTSQSNKACQQDESGQRTARPHSLMKQESEVSLDEDQVSYRDSLDLSSQSAIHTDPELDVDQGQSNSASEDPPALPDSGPPDDDTGVEQNLSATLAELNVNQSNNNNYYCSPSLSLSGLPLARLCGKKLSLSRNRDSEPDFV
uniref:Rho GTPase activating protein 45b n=1 Tax=Mastacembelus armatus TaxID=205130 RepID=A0A7N8XZK4_9TELE